MPIANGTCTGRAGISILAREDELEDFLTRSLDVLAGPHGFHEMMSMFQILLVQSVHPFREGLRDGVRLKFGES